MHKGAREWVLLNDADTKALKKEEAKDRPKTTTGSFWCTRCRRFERCLYDLGYLKGLKTFKFHLERAYVLQPISVFYRAANVWRQQA
jgi:hypothetical protein